MAIKRSLVPGFYVSGISYVHNSNDYFVLNRDNGQPIAKALVQVWEQKYDYKQSKYIKEKGKAILLMPTVSLSSIKRKRK